MSLLLALGAALSYGLADFVGGVTSQRAGAWAVAFLAQVGGGVVVLAAALLTPGAPTAADLWWAVAAGVANGFGTAFLYRGLSAGRMGVVAPVSGVGAALVPVLAGVGLGERPGGLAWVGIQVAMTTIVITLRGLLVGDHGVVLRILTVVLVLGVWFGAEYLSQRLLTHGAVAHERLLLAAGLTALGRIGIVVWSLTYLAHSLSEQAEQFGALGVVFSLFTYFLASTVVMLVATMLAAVFTEPRNGQDAVPVPATPSD